MPSNRLTRKELGARGEQLAAEHLQQNGFRIVARNWRCRSGELDLIAENEEVLLFVEVRSRTNTGTFGTAQESIDVRKMRQVRETAQVYLHMKQREEGVPVRFDVICATYHLDGSLISLDHIANAF
jgi:putative endonuclease